MYEQNKKSDPNIKKGVLDRQDKPFPTIDREMQGKSSYEFSTSKIPLKFRSGNDNIDVNGTSYPFLDDRITNKTLFPSSQIYVIDSAFVIGEYSTIRHLYSFNPGAKRTSDIVQNLISDIWIDITRNTNTYDVNKNMLTDLFENRENGQWANIERYTYTYDSNNNMLTDLFENWENGQWVNSSRGTHIYDESNNMLSALWEYWGNGQWRIASRNSYTFDGNNNMLTDLFEIWDYGQWRINDRYTYTYDANNNMLSALWEYCYNNVQWSNIDRYTYTYDSNNNLVSSLKEDWNNDQWVYRMVWTYTYDVYNNNISFLDERWSGGQLEYAHKYLFTYDAQNNMISAWHYELLDSSWVPKDTFLGRGWKAFSLYDTDGNIYVFDQSWYKINFIRKLIVTQVESQNGELPENYSLSQNYPNPFNPITKIKYSIPQSSKVVIKVFDILGSEIETLVNEEKPVGTYEVTWSASSLTSGVYFYQLSATGGAGSFVETKKMLLIK